MFSNTSKKNSSAQQWQDGQSEIFTASTVFELVGSLKAYKDKAHELPWMPQGKDGQGGLLGLSRKQDNHNLHFFRQGIQPAWEDQWNDAVSCPLCDEAARRRPAVLYTRGADSLRAARRREDA